MSKDHDKYRALYLISQKLAPKEIAAELELSYSTVLRYKKEFDDAVLNETVNDLLDIPAAVLEDLFDVVRERAPVTIDAETNELTKSLSGLAKLQQDLQLTACGVTAKIRSMAMVADSAGELSDLTDSLCKIQTAFFATGTQVNIQNNLGGATGNPSAEEGTYGDLLNDKPAHL